MLVIPQEKRNDFISTLEEKGIPGNEREPYLKWVRYFLDFCNKCRFDDSNEQSLPPFIKKLREKRQTAAQQDQAFHAIALFLGTTVGFKKYRTNAVQQKAFDRLAQTPATYGSNRNQEKLKVASKPDVFHEQKGNQGKESLPKASTQTLEKRESGASTKGQGWNVAFKDLETTIKTKRYSPKTLKSYKVWIKKLQGFVRNKATDLLSGADVKLFIEDLAVVKNVSASSQNQAFNALLFFYRHIIKKDFGDQTNNLRAKRKPYIPVVLSREEIDLILVRLPYPHDLVVKLLYGCGLRLFECLELRVNCFNYDTGILTIHDGKGKKDRTVPLPEILIPDLKAHLERVKKLHQKDLFDGYDGAFMFDAIEKKYKNCAKELIWQWFFPAKQVTKTRDTREVKRFHLHNTHVQRAIKKAVREAQICKRKRRTLFGTVSPPISCRLIMISAPFRNCWGIVM